MIRKTQALPPELPERLGDLRDEGTAGQGHGSPAPTHSPGLEGKTSLPACQTCRCLLLSDLGPWASASGPGGEVVPPGEAVLQPWCSQAMSSWVSTGCLRGGRGGRGQPTGVSAASHSPPTGSSVGKSDGEASGQQDSFSWATGTPVSNGLTTKPGPLCQAPAPQAGAWWPLPRAGCQAAETCGGGGVCLCPSLSGPKRLVLDACCHLLQGPARACAPVLCRALSGLRRPCPPVLGDSLGLFPDYFFSSVSLVLLSETSIIWVLNFLNSCSVLKRFLVLFSIFLFYFL